MIDEVNEAFKREILNDDFEGKIERYNELANKYKELYSCKNESYLDRKTYACVTADLHQEMCHKHDEFVKIMNDMFKEIDSYLWDYLSVIKNLEEVSKNIKSICKINPYPEAFPKAKKVSDLITKLTNEFESWYLHEYQEKLEKEFKKWN